MGGTFTGQNKIRPGAYINFKSVPAPVMTVGDRGISAILLPLKWGDNTGLIDVYSSDLRDGKSLAKVGFTSLDPESKLLRAMLSNCYLARVYRMDTGSDKAIATIGNLTATAKYSGEFGNEIVITISQFDSRFVVSTLVRNLTKDVQTVSGISDLQSNDFVEFSGSGVLTTNAGTPLTGGTSGTVTESTAYAEFLRLLGMAKWQTLACTSSSSTVKNSVADFIKSQTNDDGRYVQAVISKNQMDFEGNINVVMGAEIFGEEFTEEEFTAWVAGATAGASITESLTGKVVNGATRIIGERDNSDIIDGLKRGEFQLSTNITGDIKVEQDINSLHNFTQNRGYAFSKNRVLRTLYEIGTSVRLTWETSYMGRVNNDDNGRDSYRGDLVNYMFSLQAMGAITNFGGADDVSVERGNDIDSVIAGLYVQPVDSMEKLYMTVNVLG